VLSATEEVARVHQLKSPVVGNGELGGAAMGHKRVYSITGPPPAPDGVFPTPIWANNNPSFKREKATEENKS
jgi:hypothetical protein